MRNTEATDDPDRQPKHIATYLAAQRELAGIRALCLHITTGPPDTYGEIADRLEPIIEFLKGEQRRQRRSRSI